MPNPRTWDKHEIKAELGRRGVTLTAIGHRYGLSPSAVRMTLSRKPAITSADQAIADVLGVPLHVLWPDRYDDRGHRLVKLKPLKPKRPRAK